MTEGAKVAVSHVTKMPHALSAIGGCSVTGSAVRNGEKGGGGYGE